MKEDESDVKNASRLSFFATQSKNPALVTQDLIKLGRELGSMVDETVIIPFDKFVHKVLKAETRK